MEKQPESEGNGDSDRGRERERGRGWGGHEKKKNVCTLLKDSRISTDIDFDTEELLREVLGGNRRRGVGERDESEARERER